ncbi:MULTISPECIES: Dabb family protein [Paenibacillus]|uniref:Dabb family protein n=1 Tax=Paenibacillus TaxID=44249 RepID=UPI0013D4268F|nr:Dabb family protein [Paenibacillus sp. ALJ109b]NEU59911.1 Dabb family protein [Paenibacillus sp. ALJ109b]
MIINHLLIRLKDSSDTKIEETQEVLLKMKGNIATLLDMQVKIDMRRDSSSYDLMLITKFASITDMETYLVDPLHQEVSIFIGGVLDSLASVCYET